MWSAFGALSRLTITRLSRARPSQAVLQRAAAAETGERDLLFKNFLEDGPPQSVNWLARHYEHAMHRRRYIGLRTCNSHDMRDVTVTYYRQSCSSHIGYTSCENRPSDTDNVNVEYKASTSGF